MIPLPRRWARTAGRVLGALLLRAASWALTQTDPPLLPRRAPPSPTTPTPEAHPLSLGRLAVISDSPAREAPWCPHGHGACAIDGRGGWQCRLCAHRQGPRGELLHAGGAVGGLSLAAAVEQVESSRTRSSVWIGATQGDVPCLVCVITGPAALEAAASLETGRGVLLRPTYRAWAAAQTRGGEA